MPVKALTPGPDWSAREVMAWVIAPTLHAQRWSLGASPSGALSRAVHLSSGRGVLEHGDGELPLRAPVVVWLPGGAARTLAVEAGSVGVTVGVSDALLAAATGDHADGAALRQVAACVCALSAPEPELQKELGQSLAALEAEARRGSGVSRPYLTAHLTLVLVMLWRMTSREGVDLPTTGSGAHRLLRFRHLVEAQFRDHWSVARYARELSISADRLHELCVHRLRRTPLALIHQRVVREASSLLMGTDLSIERVAADLGFASSSHFSRFFRRWAGVGPKAWRDQARRQAASGQIVAPSSYADWP
jgi:AraC family transcriptional regulator, transcriptional activator of pobA